MEDRLENFIRKNKRQFDDAEVPAGLWERIEEELDEEKAVRVRQGRIVKQNLFFRIAASIVIVFSLGLMFWKYQSSQPLDLASIDPALAKQQVHYASVIEIKMTELKTLEKEEPQLYNEFSSEIKKMDESYQRLKRDLPDSPNQEETVKAMIRNLQIQTEVLNQQLNVIKQINDSKREGDETQTI